MDNFLAGNGSLHVEVEANLPVCCPALFAQWKSFRKDADHPFRKQPQLIGLQSEQVIAFIPESRIGFKSE